MEAERRTRDRFSPQGLNAHLIIELRPPEDAIIIEGNIIDISYTGIKLKLHQPLRQAFDGAEIRIIIHLPQSGIPLSIRGLIRHVEAHTEYGLQYAAEHPEESLDEFMFECIKYAPPLASNHVLPDH